MTTTLPPEPVMMEAFRRSNTSFDGVFVTGVRTTGIFCRPSCPARKPLPKNVCFFASAEAAVAEGYRPCKRCRPLERPGETPAWLRPLLEAIEADPARRWRDRDLKALGLSPARVRRWFQRHHGMTFHAYSRARRLGSALGWMNRGTGVARSAFESGYDSLSGFNEAFRRYFGANPSATRGGTRVVVGRAATPLGPMLIGATEGALCLLEFVDRRALPRQVQRVRSGLQAVFAPGSNEVTAEVTRQLDEYFGGRRQRFALPLAEVGTPFQREVWEAVRDIPYGDTRAYADIARGIGRPRAVRAVGRANGDNALAIVTPCHRVVGVGGALVGYGGGLWRKQRLLDLERDSLGPGDPIR